MPTMPTGGLVQGTNHCPPSSQGGAVLWGTNAALTGAGHLDTLHTSIAKVGYFTSGGQTDHPQTRISGPGELRQSYCDARSLLVLMYLQPCLSQYCTGTANNLQKCLSRYKYSCPLYVQPCQQVLNYLAQVCNVPSSPQASNAHTLVLRRCEEYSALKGADGSPPQWSQSELSSASGYWDSKWEWHHGHG